MGLSWSHGLSRESTPFYSKASRVEPNRKHRYYHSSSCAIRSGIICYNIANQFVFDPALFVDGKNEIILSLPANATDYQSAVLPTTTYVQYDALRLEIKS